MKLRYFTSLNPVISTVLALYYAVGDVKIVGKSL